LGVAVCAVCVLCDAEAYICFLVGAGVVDVCTLSVGHRCFCA
jgi:hypothetical protein